MKRPDLMALEMEVERMNPRIHLGEDMLKQVKSWSVGEKYTIEIEVKMLKKEEELDEPVEAKFEVLKAKVI